MILEHTDHVIYVQWLYGILWVSYILVQIHLLIKQKEIAFGDSRDGQNFSRVQEWATFLIYIYIYIF